jgi:cysteine-rich repeat protein
MVSQFSCPKYAVYSGINECKADCGVVIQCSATDRIYNLSLDKYNQNLHVYAINRTDGAIIKDLDLSIPFAGYRFDHALAIDKNGSGYILRQHNFGATDLSQVIDYTTDLVRINSDGSVPTIGPTGLPSYTEAMDFGFDGKLYALNDWDDSLYTLDTTTGKATRLFTFPKDVFTPEGGDLIADPAQRGLLYVDNSGRAYHIDLRTFAVTPVFNLPVSPYSAYMGLSYVDGTYYITDDTTGHLFKFTRDPLVVTDVTSSTNFSTSGDLSVCVQPRADCQLVCGKPPVGCSWDNKTTAYDANGCPADCGRSICGSSSSSSSQPPPAPPPVCGNGIHEAKEECDDGNRNPGDGCSFSCTIEEGFICRLRGPFGGSSSSACAIDANAIQFLSLSNDGRFLAYGSYPKLEAGSVPASIFLYDHATDTNKSLTGGPGQPPRSAHAYISGDGKTVVIPASDFDPTSPVIYTNPAIYMYDRLSGAYTTLMTGTGAWNAHLYGNIQVADNGDTAYLANGYCLLLYTKATDTTRVISGPDAATCLRNVRNPVASVPPLSPSTISAPLSTGMVMSRDGRFIAYVASPQPDTYKIFLYDRTANTITDVSRTALKVFRGPLVISHNGRYLSYQGQTTDAQSWSDWKVFFHDLRTDNFSTLTDTGDAFFDYPYPNSPPSVKLLRPVAIADDGHTWIVTGGVHPNNLTWDEFAQYDHTTHQGTLLRTAGALPLPAITPDLQTVADIGDYTPDVDQTQLYIHPIAGPKGKPISTNYICK